MNFHRLAALQNLLGARVEEQAPETVKRQEKATKVRMRVPAAVFVPVLKAVRSRFPEDFPSEVLIMFSPNSTLL